jgi:FkbM family methyltransferase
LATLNTPIVFDVGANKGNYIKMVIEINQNSKILAFEPDTTAYNKLKNIKSDNVTLHNFGLSDKVGDFEFYNREDELGSEHSSLYKDVITDIHKVGFISTFYKFSTIDNFVKENNISRIDLLKVDTEGHELAVLAGAKETIKTGKVPVIHFEFNEMNVISRAFFRDFIQMLSEYDFYRMLPDNLVKLEPYIPVKMEIFAFQNIVAVRKGVDL